jgi:hypothetical protein
MVPSLKLWFPRSEIVPSLKSWFPRSLNTVRFSDFDRTDKDYFPYRDQDFAPIGQNTTGTDLFIGKYGAAASHNRLLLVQ